MCIHNLFICHSFGFVELQGVCSLGCVAVRPVASHHAFIVKQQSKTDTRWCLTMMQAFSEVVLNVCASVQTATCPHSKRKLIHTTLVVV